MRIIQTKKGEGKTTQIIKEASKLKGYNLIVCMDKREVARVWEKILIKKYNLPQPITFDEFIEGAYKGGHITSFLIDNADMLIQHLSRGVRVHVITCNKD